MEKAICFPASARLHAVGVIGFVPTANSYHPYPAGNHTSMPSAKWRKNPSIHYAMGSSMPPSQH